MQVLAEIMPQAAGLLHVFSQLHITAGFHAQQLVFPVQLGVPGVLLRHPVHLVQQQEDAQQRDGHRQHRNDHDPVEQDDRWVQRDAEDEEGRIDGRQRPRRLPERFAVIFLQEPCAPPDGCEMEEDAQHRREPQRQQRCGDQIGLLLVAGLGAGVQHHGHQRTDRQHDSGDREQEGRLADGHSLRPPSQQPERNDEDGEQENVAGQFKDRAQRCTPKA